MIEIATHSLDLEDSPFDQAGTARPDESPAESGAANEIPQHLEEALGRGLPHIRNAVADRWRTIVVKATTLPVSRRTRRTPRTGRRGRRGRARDQNAWRSGGRVHVRGQLVCEEQRRR